MLKAAWPSATQKELMGELGKRFREAKEAVAAAPGGVAADAMPLQCVEVDDEAEEAEAALAALRLA